MRNAGWVPDRVPQRHSVGRFIGYSAVWNYQAGKVAVPEDGEDLAADWLRNHLRVSPPGEVLGKPAWVFPDTELHNNYLKYARYLDLSSEQKAQLEEAGKLEEVQEFRRWFTSSVPTRGLTFSELQKEVLVNWEFRPSGQPVPRASWILEARPFDWLGEMLVGGNWKRPGS